MATDVTTMEARLEAVEAAVAELKRKVEVRAVDPDWLDKISGILDDYPEFEEVIRLGREFRMAERPDERGDA